MGSDFNVRHRFAGCFILVLLTTILSGVAHADTDQADPAVHRQAYEAALANVLTGPDRILDEMVRIRRGEVAHYDFLQYQHIELIRHARALAHPPATLNEADRARISKVAAEVLTAANDLEWIIADFLRAHALEQIRQKQPDRVATGRDPDLLLAPLRHSSVKEAVDALQRQYRTVTRT